MNTMDLTALIPAEEVRDAARAEALATLAQLRWHYEVGGLTLPDGARFEGARVATDRDSQQRIAMAAQAGIARRWKTQTGWLMLTPEALQDLAERVAAHVQAGFDAEHQVAGQIATAPAPEALDLTAAFTAALLAP